MSPPPCIGIVTCRAHPRLSASDALYARALEALGCSVSVLPWNDTPFTVLLELDGLVLRATWDAPDDMYGFRAWSERLEREGPRCFNSPGLARRNLDKRSVLELAKRGVTLPRTLVLDDDRSARDAMRALSCETAVLKPCWGGDGVGVERVTTETCDAVAERLRRDLTRPLLVQEFLPEIEGGELSFVFVGGVIGHVVRKRPAPGEFRVNSRFSPLPRVVEAATARLLDDAHAVLDAVGEPTLYARIDGVERDGRLICTEVELADPSLYLDLEPSTAARFAEATVEAARAQGGRTPWQRTQAPVTAPRSTTTISSRLT